MNGTFTKLYSNATAGSFTGIRGAFTSPLSTVFSSVNRFKTYLEEATAKSTNIVTGFLIDPEGVCDQLTEGCVISRLKPHYGNIDAGVAQSIISAWLESADADGNLVLTDVDGVDYHVSISNESADAITCVVHDSLPDPSVVVSDLVLLHLSQDSATLNNVMIDVHGVPHCTFDVIRSLLVSSELNDCLLSFARVATSGAASSAALATAASEYASKGIDSVRSTSNQLRMAFDTGGIYGLCKAILSFAKSGASIVDDNGVMTFSDNSKFVPAEYISGLLSTIFTTVGQLVSMLILTFNAILGVVAFIATQLISMIVQAVNFDYEGTKGSLNEADVCTSSSPYGIFQAVVPGADMPQVVVDAFELGYPLLIVDVIGGQLVIGHGTPDGSGNPTYRLEFHPSFDDYSEVWHEIDSFFTATHDTEHTGNYKIDITVANGYYDNFIIACANAANSNSVSTYVNSDTGYLSDPDDEIVRRNMVQNAIMFLMYTAYNEYHGDTGGSFSLYFNADADVMTNHANFTMDLSSNRNMFYMEPGYDTSANRKKLMAYAWMLYHYWGSRMGNLIPHTFITPFYAYLWSDSYVNLADIFTIWQTTLHVRDLTYFSYVPIFRRRLYFGNIQELSGTTEYALKVPKYNRATFWKWVLLASVTTAVAAGAIIGVSVAVKHSIRRAQAKAAAKVFKANEDYQNNPTKENYKAYSKAVFKNNLLATFTGGTKYDRVNVWNGGSNVENSSAGSVGSALVHTSLGAMANTNDPSVGSSAYQNVDVNNDLLTKMRTVVSFGDKLDHIEELICPPHLQSSD